MSDGRSQTTKPTADIARVLAEVNRLLALHELRAVLVPWKVKAFPPAPSVKNG